MPTAAAQCSFAGEARIDRVTPRGGDLQFGVTEQARVTIDGTRARVEGVRPIAFVGSAASRDVALFLAADRTVQGVLSVRAGTPLRVRRVVGARAAGFIDAESVRVALSVPCGELSLSSLAPDMEESSVEDDLDHVLLVRGRSLWVYAGPTTSRGVRLALRGSVPSSRWPLLAARGASGTRIHVRATLAGGVTIDGWVDGESVHLPGLSISASCGCEMASAAVCGHGYAGETYRGAARIAAGAVLRDGDGRVWGQVAEDIDATVAMSTMTATSHPADGSPEVYRIETVWIEALPGLIFDSCAFLPVQVDRAAVTIPAAPP